MFIFLAGFSQKAPHPSTNRWIRSYSLHGPDAGSMNIIETYDKGYIILGRDNWEHFGVILKIDINGKLLWYKQIGKGWDWFYVTNIEQTIDNNYIISATTVDYDNENEACVIKINNCGELEWCSRIYNPLDQNDIGGPVKPTPDGGCILYRLDQAYTTKRNNLYKFDINGNLIWHQRYYPDSLVYYEEMFDLLVDSAGIYMTGDCEYGNYPGNYYFYNIKTYINGTQSWAKVTNPATNYCGDGWASLRNVNGSYFTFGDHTDSAGYWYPSYIKLLPDGTIANSSNLYNRISTWANDAIWYTLDTIIVACTHDSSGLECNSLLKMDTSNTFHQWINFPAIDFGLSGLAKTFDNKFIAVGTDVQGPLNWAYIQAYKVNSSLGYDTIYKYSFVYDSLCPHQISNDTIDPNCQLMVNVNEPFDNQETVKLVIYPNPASLTLKVVFPQYLMLKSKSDGINMETVFHSWDYTVLDVYNIEGKIIISQKIPKELPNKLFDVSDWPSGIYCFHLTYSDRTIGSEKVIIFH